MIKEAQSLAVKRAEVEFHNFASLGEPELAMRVYAEENQRRGAVLNNHRSLIGSLSPFLEIGANAGHTSYMLANEFGAEGFALDISADSLRYGIALKDAWGLDRSPVRIAGDAVHLPFRDNSLRFVCAFQMLSQFMDIEAVFLEVKRVLEPGGIFLFAEEPLKRLLTLSLYRCAYWDTMKPWERKLYEWGLLGYLVRDVIGAGQEESFGIRQNHTMDLKDWHRLILKHFDAEEHEIFVPERGWGERVVKRALIRLDPLRSEWRAARVLGGTLAAACKKAGGPVESRRDMDRFQDLLRCPDCGGDLTRDAGDTLRCGLCHYTAPNEGGVYNLLASADREELYPGDREDIIDFSLPSHAGRLGEGWYDLEGVFGNKYRWIGPRATARLKRVGEAGQRLRIRGHANERSFASGENLRLSVVVNGEPTGDWTLSRPGLFVLESDVPPAEQYYIEISAAPGWTVPTDERILTVNLSMIRLVPRDSDGP